MTDAHYYRRVSNLTNALDPATVSIMFSLYGRSGRILDALALFRRASDRGALNMFAVDLMIDACIRNDKMIMAMQVVGTDGGILIDTICKKRDGDRLKYFGGETITNPKESVLVFCKYDKASRKRARDE